ncbi:MAG: DUF928 domain-containing protein [Leptolyngbyaceae bacterium]|nr:DUF928 domain-containing protein [Leptolyngbyaceae bacterium]
MQKPFMSALLVRTLSLSAVMVSGWSALVLFPYEVQALPDFSETGRSGNRVGGASRRGGCAVPEHQMMPIAPLGADYGGRTIHAQPTVWVYVPYALDEESPVTFAINEENGDELYQATFTATVDPGVYGIQIPESVELEPNLYYDWYVLVYCNDPLRQEVPSFAGGWIQRVETPSDVSAEGLDAMPPVEQSQFFADRLLWYDALTPLGEALQANSDHAVIRSAWNELLALPSVQLDDLTQFPVTPCCEMPEGES